MKKKSKIILISICCLLICISVIVAVAVGINLGRQWSVRVYNAYEDDTIISGKSNDNLRENSNHNYSEYCYSETTSGFSGVDKIDNFKLSSGDVLNISLQIFEGDFKIVLVEDQHVITLIDESYNGDLIIPDGDYILKIVGLNANFKLEITKK